MTQQQILDYCIEMYEFFVQDAPQKEDLIGFLVSQHAEYGMCNFVQQNFGYDLYSKATWIKDNAQYDFVFWCDAPMSIKVSRGTNEEIIKTLQIRLSILKSIKL